MLVGVGDSESVSTVEVDMPKVVNGSDDDSVDINSVDSGLVVMPTLLDCV